MIVDISEVDKSLGGDEEEENQKLEQLDDFSSPSIHNQPKGLIPHLKPQAQLEINSK